MKLRTQAAALVALLAFAVPAFAQQPPAPPRPPGRMGPPQDSLRPRMLNVETALRLKQELKLTESQAGQLETLRKEIVAERQAHMRDAIDFQSRVAAGLVSRDDMLKQFENRRTEQQQRMQQHQDRVAKILTAEQQQQLQREMRGRMFERMHRRMGVRRGGMGPGMWGGPGRPGMRMRDGMGRGFGPGPWWF